MGNSVTLTDAGTRAQSVLTADSLSRWSLDAVSDWR